MPVISFFVVTAAGLLQFTNWFNIGGVKPNFILAALITTSFFIIGFRAYAAVMIPGLFFATFQAAPEIEVFILAALSVTAFLIGKRLPWFWAVNNSLMIFLGTFLFYAIARAAFLYNDFGVVAIETAFNVIIGTLLFLCLKKS